MGFELTRWQIGLIILIIGVVMILGFQEDGVSPFLIGLGAVVFAFGGKKN